MCTGLEPFVAALFGTGAGTLATAGIASGLGAAGAGLVGGQLLQPKIKMPAIPTPEKPPQATKAPNRTAILTPNAAGSRPGGAFSGNSGTFLTGPSGIDPATLNLGRNTLLGQ
jgi:hypothetical protein